MPVHGAPELASGRGGGASPRRDFRPHGTSLGKHGAKEGAPKLQLHGAVDEGGAPGRRSALASE
eukprot:2246004-Lingulodinium_polyedra.AAC.1